VVTEGSGEVDRPGAAEHADGQGLPRAGHDLRGGAAANLQGVLGEGGVAEVVQAVLDRPVPAEVVGEPGGAGLGEGEAGDRIDGHSPPPPGAGVEVMIAAVNSILGGAGLALLAGRVGGLGPGQWRWSAWPER
jgi:hypothetical protein